MQLGGGIMVVPSRRGIWWWIIYVVTVGPFTVIYALTVTPFTVQFFRTFAQSPDAGGAMLLRQWPLREIHDLFLPFFIICLEVISIQLAASLWSLQMSHRLLLAMPVLLVLLGAQAFPTFSVYFDSRNTAFGKNTELKAAEPLKVAEVKGRNDQLTKRYQDQKTEHEKIVDNAVKGLDGQRSECEGELRLVNADIDRLLEVAKQPGGWTEAHWADFNLKKDRRDALEKDLTRIAGERQGWYANPPHQAPDQPVLEPLPASQPKYGSAVEYMTGTAGTPEGVLSLFVAFIFPCVVLGAGYLIARYGGGSSLSDAAYQPPLPYLNLTTELSRCATLPKERQLGYAKQVIAFVRFYVGALRALRQLADRGMSLHVAGENQLEELRILQSAEEEVRRSGIAEEAKTEVRAALDSFRREPIS